MFHVLSLSGISLNLQKSDKSNQPLKSVITMTTKKHAPWEHTHVNADDEETEVEFLTHDEEIE